MGTGELSLDSVYICVQYRNWDPAGVASNLLTWRSWGLRAKVGAGAALDLGIHKSTLLHHLVPEQPEEMLWLG